MIDDFPPASFEKCGDEHHSNRKEKTLLPAPGMTARGQLASLPPQVRAGSRKVRTDLELSFRELGAVFAPCDSNGAHHLFIKRTPVANREIIRESRMVRKARRNSLTLRAALADDHWRSLRHTHFEAVKKKHGPGHRAVQKARCHSLTLQTVLADDR